MSEETQTEMPVETEATTGSGKNLYQKLLAVYRDVQYVQKTGNNTFHKYRYVTEADVKAKLHESFMKQGLIFNLSITDMTEAIDGKNRLVTCKFSYRFIDAETGDSLDGTSYGTGADTLDKGLYKAIAGGLKYILTSNFLIPTGDDPEDDKYEKELAEQEAKAAAAAAAAAAKPVKKTPAPKPVQKAPTPAPAVQTDDDDDAGVGDTAPTACGICSDPITTYTSVKGKVFQADVLIAESTKKYGTPMCATCQIAKGKEAQEGAGARVN